MASRQGRPLPRYPNEAIADSGELRTLSPEVRPAVGNFATARLAAEKLDEAHLNDLTRLHLGPEVSLYLGDVRSPRASKTYLDTNLAHWAEHGFGLWVLRTRDGAFVGRAGLRHIELESSRAIEIAYSLVRTHWTGD